MRKHVVLMCVLFEIVLTSGSGLPRATRRRYPKQAMMISGYYTNPMQMSDFPPAGLMSMFASGDSVATNSFLDRHQPPLGEDPADETTIEEEPSNDGAKNAPDEEEENDDHLGQWPFQSGNRQFSSINTFFPISFGGGLRRNGKGKQNEEELGYTGSATAIANSFSTGRGGVANSHATAFGDPSLAAFFKKHSNRKNIAKDE